jgi:hypothetical protein
MRAIHQNQHKINFKKAEQAPEHTNHREEATIQEKEVAHNGDGLITSAPTLPDAQRRSRAPGERHTEKNTTATARRRKGRTDQDNSELIPFVFISVGPTMLTGRSLLSL